MTVWLAGSGEAIYNDVYTAILDNWVAERAPGSTHELTFIAWSDYFSKLSTGLAGGAAPDVYMTGYGQMGSMNAQGYELNLSDYSPRTGTAGPISRRISCRPGWWTAICMGYWNPTLACWLTARTLPSRTASPKRT